MNKRTFPLAVTLPADMADLADQIDESDPDFFSRVVLMAVCRRVIYKSLGDSMGKRIMGLGTHMEREA